MEELTKQQPGGAASYTDKLGKYPDCVCRRILIWPGCSSSSLTSTWMSAL